ncbi:tripartite motif containing 109 isoform X2 [Denticeps clupeoides]|uniref:tripartite motif containing 109 isoform X2 n=1 Tax=Denticeps clupeoides TaxID=299321 RepID=UPI0010A41120|nr:zinc-binding protein A33-like isoform X2 [Denticeps clupeoides]
MASALSEHIQCSLCLTEFSDPVSLRCHHTFCRKCIRQYLESTSGQALCPECRKPYTRKHIKANRTLTNIVDAAKEHLTEHQALRDIATTLVTNSEPEKTQKQGSAELCPKHDEKLKLFCETDQELVCLVCRDGDMHRGHTFRPVEEMAETCKVELTKALHFTSKENTYLDYLIELQNKQITNAKWWNGTGQDVVNGMKNCDSGEGSSADEYMSKVGCFTVNSNSVTLGPYETHLLMFIWKEMIEIIKPVPHHDVIEAREDPYLIVSPSRHSVQRADRQGLFGLYKNYRPLVRGSCACANGHHYWEVEVGQKLDWGVGVCSEPTPGLLQEGVMLFLKHDIGYCISNGEADTPIHVSQQPWRVGVFLDCKRQWIYFYNAENMCLLHSTLYSSKETLYLCLSPGVYLDGKNTEPITVSWWRSNTFC